MDVLTDKKFEKYDYLCRYTGVPCYFNNVDQKEVPGLTYNLIKNSPWVAHTVTETDTLDYLALKYYNNPTLWWVIGKYNDIQDAFIDNLSQKYTTLKIPSITTLTSGDLR